MTPTSGGRRVVAVVTVLTSVLAFAPSARAAADCDGTAITWPEPGQTVAGRARVYGSAAIDAFQFYKVEFASARAPEAWSATSDVVRAPARHTRLDGWSTDDLADGPYRLKLTVVDTAAQERCQRIVENVLVANAHRASAVAPDVAPRSLTGSSAPWPTAAARRAAMQATIASVASAESATSETMATSATSATWATPALSATSGTASAEAAPDAAATAEPTPAAALGQRFAVPFVLGFLVVAALMVTLGRLAFRTPDGAGKTRR